MSPRDKTLIRNRIKVYKQERYRLEKRPESGSEARIAVIDQRIQKLKSWLQGPMPAPVPGKQVKQTMSKKEFKQTFNQEFNVKETHEVTIDNMETLEVMWPSIRGELGRIRILSCNPDIKEAIKKKVAEEVKHMKLNGFR